MSGDIDNPRIWVNADVLVASTGSTAPTDTGTAWDAAWDTVGLLSEDGISEAREQDTTDHYAYGGVLVRTTRSKHKRTMKVTVLEDNPVVFDLVNPGSSASTGITGPATPLIATAATDVFAATAHGLVAGNAVRFDTIVGPTVPAIATTYYVIASGLTANAFKVSATPGGSTINIDADGTANFRKLSNIGVTTRTVKVPQPNPKAFGLELVDGAITKRRVIPKGEVIEVGEVSISDSEMAMYELTINVYPASDKTLYFDITDDPQAA